MNITEKDKARFWVKAHDTGYCWEWQGGLGTHGYGSFKLNGRDHVASRISFFIINGAILNNGHVLHKCDNPCCVNPDHLFVGTHDDNMKDKMHKGRGRRLGRASKYLGVGFRKDSNNWRAYIIYSVNGKRKHISLGSFDNEEDAAKRRDQGVKELKLNLPLNFNV